MRYLTHIIEPVDEGRQVQAVLKDRLHLGRARIRAAKFRENGITLDGARVYTIDRVHAGQVLKIAVGDSDEALAASSVVPTPGPLDIVFEDDDLIVLNKPAGISTHPGPKHVDDTLGNYLMHYFQSTGQRCLLHPVQRLDWGTSGLIVFAKNAHTQQFLQKRLHTGNFCRRYLAFCQGAFDGASGAGGVRGAAALADAVGVGIPVGAGVSAYGDTGASAGARISAGAGAFVDVCFLPHEAAGEVFPGRSCACSTEASFAGLNALDSNIPPVQAGVIDAPIGCIGHTWQTAAVLEGGKPARTYYWVQKQARAGGVDIAKVLLQLETGRTHQIRIHLSHIGHPLLGDAAHGGIMRLPGACCGNGEEDTALRASALGRTGESSENCTRGDAHGNEHAESFPYGEADAASPARDSATSCDFSSGDGIVRPGSDIAIARPALHSAFLQVEHPVSGKLMTFEAPLPPDLALLDALF